VPRPHFAAAAAAALLSLAALPQALAQPAGTIPIPDGGVSVVMRCKQCGIINSVREIQQVREGATPGLGPDAPVGLVIYIPTGPGSRKGDSFAGSVGNREWQNRITSTRYEFTVRMDDGDYRLVQKDGVSDLRVGDRVRVEGGRIERWGS
jgi:outer membrane lipoprotein SlyB